MPIRVVHFVWHADKKLIHAPGLVQAPIYSSQYLALAIVGTFRDVETNAIRARVDALAVLRGVSVEIVYATQMVSVIRKGIEYRLSLQSRDTMVSLRSGLSLSPTPLGSEFRLAKMAYTSCDLFPMISPSSAFFRWIVVSGLWWPRPWHAGQRRRWPSSYARRTCLPHIHELTRM
jgi:hypothetical protein